MVQTHKIRAAGNATKPISTKPRRAISAAFRRNHCAPAPEKNVSIVQRKTRAVLGDKILKIMAARVAHQGGELKYVQPSGDITIFAKSGPRMGLGHTNKLIAAQVAKRRTQAARHQALIADEVQRKMREVEEEEQRREEAKEAQVLAQTKQLEPAPKRFHFRRELPLMSEEDDVAGPYYEQEGGVEEVEAEEGRVSEEEQEDHAKGVRATARAAAAAPLASKSTKKAAANSSSSKSKSAAAAASAGETDPNMGRAKGFRGVPSKTALAVLEEDF